MLFRKLIGAWVLPPLQGLTSFLWPTQAKACVSWPFGPLSAFVRLRPPMMGLSTEQAEAVKRQERERMPLRNRGRPNDVSRWIISLADWITGLVLAVGGGLDLV